jgi:hypothetical protein
MKDALTEAMDTEGLKQVLAQIMEGTTGVSPWILRTVTVLTRS